MSTVVSPVIDPAFRRGFACGARAEGVRAFVLSEAGTIGQVLASGIPETGSAYVEGARAGHRAAVKHPLATPADLERALAEGRPL